MRTRTPSTTGTTTRTATRSSTLSAVRRVIATAAAFAFAAVALVAGPAAGAATGAKGATAEGRGHKSGLCPDGYVCLHPGGIGVPEPHLIPEYGSEYFVPPYIASAVENHTNVIVWVTTADGSATWIPPHTSVTLWPVASVDSVVSQCFVPMPY